jgi:hypothetical protein
MKDQMRRAIGLGFCAIAAFLFAARYICAAIFGSNVASWSAELFRAMYGYVGPGLSIAAGVSLVVGIVYLVWGERTGK